MNFKQSFSTIDTHVAGEAFRIVLNSAIKIAETSIEKANEVLQNSFTREKNLLLNEPRGHRGMQGCLVFPTNAADIRLLSFQHEGVNEFKYEGVLATITALVETGSIRRNENDTYSVETIKGIITVKATVENHEVIAASLNCKSCVKVELTEDDLVSRIDNDRNYVIYQLPDTIPTLELQHLAAIQQWGTQKTTELSHQETPYNGVILVEHQTHKEVRSVTFEKDGYILRTPGIDSSFAILTAMDEKKEIRNTSIFGAYLDVKVGEEEEKQCLVETEAFVTGSHDFIVDDDDPLQEGFLLA